MYILANFWRLLVDLGQELVVAEKRVLLLSNLDGTSSELASVSIYPFLSLLLLFHLMRDEGYIPPPTWGIKTLSPGCTLGATRLPSLSNAPGPTARTFASLSSLTAVSGRKMPVAVFASGLTRCTRMRSRSGAIERIDLMADCVVLVWGYVKRSFCGDVGGVEA